MFLYSCTITFLSSAWFQIAIRNCNKLWLQYCCCSVLHNRIAAAIAASLNTFFRNFPHRNAITTSIVSAI